MICSNQILFVIPHDRYQTIFRKKVQIEKFSQMISKYLFFNRKKINDESIVMPTSFFVFAYQKTPIQIFEPSRYAPAMSVLGLLLVRLVSRRTNFLTKFIFCLPVAPNKATRLLIEPNF